MVTDAHIVFNTTWSGQVLLNTTGRAEKVGATRTFGIGGGVTLTEEVILVYPR